MGAQAVPQSKGLRERQGKQETTPKQSTNLKDLRTKMETTLEFTTTTRI